MRIAVRTDGSTGGAVLFSDSFILLFGQFCIRRVENEVQRLCIPVQLTVRMSALMMSASTLYEFGDLVYKVSLWNVIFWFWTCRFYFSERKSLACNEVYVVSRCAGSIVMTSA